MSSRPRPTLLQPALRRRRPRRSGLPAAAARPVWCLCCTSATRLLVYVLHHVSPYRTVSS